MNPTHNRRPRILIVNDDGIEAEGIYWLWKSLKDHADVTVVAPTVQQSAVGLCVTVRHPLHIYENSRFEKTPAWSVTGSPADCVKIALNVLLDKEPDFIVSGINSASNNGRNALYSGTVGGVIEGVLRGIPGIAFSCDIEHGSPRYDLASRYIPHIVSYLLDNPLRFGSLLNVNIPSGIDDIKGLRWTRQSKEYYLENIEQRQHPVEPFCYYWLGARIARFDEDIQSDADLLKAGYITAVPIHVSDLTDTIELNDVRQKQFEQLMDNVLTPASPPMRG